MAEDTFIREVDEQMRQDRAQELWAKYGKYIIALAILIVLGTAAINGWKYYQDNRAAAFGDEYMKAIDLSNKGKHDEAIAALEAIGKNGSGGFPALAQMRIAGEMITNGKKAEALKAFDAIAADASYSEIFRQIATLRAGIIAVDLEDYAGVEKRLLPLTKAGGAFRHSAREALGIAAMKAGNNKKALEMFSEIVNDANAAAGARSRSQLMLNVLAGKGVKADG